MQTCGKSSIEKRIDKQSILGNGVRQGVALKMLLCIDQLVFFAHRDASCALLLSNPTFRGVMPQHACCPGTQ